MLEKKRYLAKRWLGGVDEESDVPGDLRKLRYKYSENYS